MFESINRKTLSQKPPFDRRGIPRAIEVWPESQIFEV